MRKLKTAASGKVTGCACKHNGVKCGDKCSCGSRSKPCKNRVCTLSLANITTIYNEFQLLTCAMSVLYCLLMIYNSLL
jgi:hypothetical protein